MKPEDLYSTSIKDRLGISKDFGNIFTFIDFGNVNKWFEDDDRDLDNKLLAAGDTVLIGMAKLKNFSDSFSAKTKIYYGEDPSRNGSQKFIYALRKIFGSENVETKDIQKIKHYFRDSDEIPSDVAIDRDGKKYVEIRKANFDVEISVDAIKMLKHYDTFCLFSGDSDFTYLNNFLRLRNKKKIILVKGGNILRTLKKSVDLIINAQDIKFNIAEIKKAKT